MRGGAGVGTHHQPHSARSCELALLSVGAARGRPGGPPPAWVWGVRGRALFHLQLPAVWTGCRGPLPTGCGCGGVRAWGPVTNPTARALVCCEGSMRVPGGGASCLGLGRRGSGALPPPTARPLGGLPGPTTHWLWVRGGAGVGTRHQPHSARSCELALRPVGAARGRLGGAPPAWVWGVRGRALSHPRLPALWAGCRGLLPTGCGCGGVGAWGPVTNPTARALACRGGCMRVPGGGRLLPGCGASGVGRSPTPDCPPSGRAAGAHYPLASGAGGCGRGDPSPTPQRALLRGPRWEHFGDFGDSELLATWSLARFCGPCQVDRVRAEEVLRLRTGTPSAIPPGEEILTWIWSTIPRTDRFPRCQTPNRGERFSPLLP